jgi:4-amino-4-deoxy-L-arabinose transferase-like glycosyltransferase
MEETEKESQNEENPEKNPKRLTQRIKKWFKDPYNLTLFSILILALVIRLYYFFLTMNQPVWWDEGEYMIAAKSFFHRIPITGLSPIREMVIPFFWGILYFISPGEILIRFSQVIVSTLVILLTYLVGRKLFNGKIGLIASFLMTFYCIHLFFTVRLLTYLWAPLIYLVVIFFFLKREENPKYFYLSAAVLSLGIVTYFSSSFLLIALLIFLLLEQRFSFFKKKENYIALGTFIIVLLPFVTYYMLTKGALLPRFIQINDVLNASAKSSILPFNQWFGYFADMSRLLQFPLLIIFIIGIIYFLEVILGLDLILKNKSQGLKNKLFVWIWFLVPMIAYSAIEIIQGKGMLAYDGFTIPVFPAIFMICALILIWVYDFVKKYSKVFAIILLFVILAWSAYSQITYADQIIKAKIPSYKDLQGAGLYIKDHSSPGDIIFSAAIPELTYYSERPVYNFPANESFFKNNISVLKPKFMVLTVYEKAPDWAYSWPENNTKVSAEMGYFLDPQQKQVSTVIYKFNY